MLRFKYSYCQRNASALGLSGLSPRKGLNLAQPPVPFVFQHSVSTVVGERSTNTNGLYYDLFGGI
jgi:hypothetical protein